ncbi:MAG: ClpX C4-type zinc finger protein [Streptosporangiaceae bacterium]
MDERLFAEARRAQERMVDAERDAEVARAEFNRAVRRLHLNGSSLRELAAALGLSHQRVHQIVESAGGSRRWRRRRDPRANPACTFCGKPEGRVRDLIAGPNVYICDGCVGLAKTVMASGDPVRTQVSLIVAVPEREKRERCSFCGKYRNQVPGMAALPSRAGKKAPVAAVCGECLALCDEIIAEKLT